MKTLIGINNLVEGISTSSAIRATDKTGFLLASGCSESEGILV